MSADGAALAAVAGVEEACATARARVEDLVAEIDDLRTCLCSVIAQRDEARAKADTYERDWYASKVDFGTAVGKMREAVRAAEKRELESLAELDEARAQLAAALEAAP